MTLGQNKIIKNYNSLSKKLSIQNAGEISLFETARMLEFCALFDSNDITLYQEFQKEGLENIDAKHLVEMYAKRYVLNPERDLEKIVYQFVENTITNGIAYHLGNSANQNSIMQVGLNPNTIGIKTEENKDYELLKNTLPEEEFRRVQPFAKDYEKPVFYYSNKPILAARYGEKPEWLMELKTNSILLDPDKSSMKLIDAINEKYDKKYANSSKVLYIIPNPEPKLTEEEIDEILKQVTPMELIDAVLSKLTYGVNCSSEKHIPSSEIISMDLTNGKLYGLENGEFKELTEKKEADDINYKK